MQLTTIWSATGKGLIFNEMSFGFLIHFLKFVLSLWVIECRLMGDICYFIHLKLNLHNKVCKKWRGLNIFWSHCIVHSESIQTPSLFAHFAMLQPYPVSLYTQYLMITKWKQDFRTFSKFIEKEKLKYHIDISFQTLYSVLSWSTFAWQALHTWIWGISAILLYRTSQVLSGWMGTVSGHFWFGSSQGLWLGHHGPWHSQPLHRCLGCVLRVIVLL